MCCGDLDSEQILKRTLVIAIPIVIILAISAGLLGGSVKDLYPVRILNLYKILNIDYKFI